MYATRVADEIDVGADGAGGMGRQARLIVPGYPHHVVQRGHNRGDVFGGPKDYRVYLENLAEGKQELGCRIYAFCLMPNHVHLIVDPVREPASMSLLMKGVAGRQTRYMNAAMQWKGTLWEGRYRSSVIATDRYLAACCRYVEMNPVKAGLVDSPAAYPWSSFRARAGMCETPWLDDPPLSKGLSSVEPLVEGQWEALEKALRLGLPAGEQESLLALEAAVGRRLLSRPVGRPRSRRACEGKN